ncbi:MAG: hypothetical protein CMQ15_07860 [Gammaproteobacteria bacterium]|nr:hypothetical protein [Gammaproteobacteria bacterium]|tara:strand:+ start:6062 stop:7231 length:1170 start_codon:yes stop_codon:yes gene_type:complete
MTYPKHKRVCALLIISLLLGLAEFGSYALQVNGLYEQRVAIANESDTERDRAFREALEAVLLKITGERRWLEHPVLQQAVRNAQSYVEGISYASETVEVIADELPRPADPETDQAGQVDPELAASSLPALREQRYIDVNFAASLLDELLASANIPVWDSNRPSVLVWLALQNAEGERSMLTADSNPRIIAIIQDFVTERGLPIIFPVLDFEDRRALSEEALWTQDEAVISVASSRYGADSVLSGRLLFTASGELVGLWQFIFQGQVEVFDGYDEELAGYLNAPLDRITNQLASYFAIVPETSSQQVVRLRVEGIKDLSAYSALVSYVSSLGLVQSVSMAALDGERLELQLGLLGDPQQLFELIALDRDLLPITSSQLDPRTVLHYRWTR